MAEKIVIGVTGNIATGKSLVLRMLQELGCLVIDADKLAHQLMRQGSPVYEAIVEQFGKYIVDSSGQIHRSRLGRIVFGDPEALNMLEQITHPGVRREILKQVEQTEAPVVAIEAIKLFESNLNEICQSIWVVTSPPEVQLKRLVERRKMKPETAQQRIRAQGSPDPKIAKADVVIDNSDDLGKTWAFVKQQYKELLQAQKGEAQPVAAPQPAPATEATAPEKAIAEADIIIRRAKRPDLQAMAKLVEVSTQGRVSPDISHMMESLFSRGYIVAAVNEHVVGMAGWQTENLIAGLQDFYVLRDDLWTTAGQKMLDKIHEEVDNLSCEAALSFVLKAAGSKPIEFFKTQGYEQIEPDELNRIWREATEAAQEWQPENSVLLFKKLREQRIMVPM